MAQLKDTIVTGDLSVTGTIYGGIPLNNLTDADDLKAIEALTGTSGILTKTADNTWSLASGATPASHAHGNITNAGAIGTTANLPVFTTTNGVLNTVTAATALTNLGAAASGHTHATTIATSTGTNQLTLAFNTKYALTAGGTSYIFTTPANPNTDTKVTQAAAITTNGAYPILLGYDTNTTAVTNTVNKGALTYNPSTKALKTGLTTTANAIAIYTDTAGTLGTKATAAGAAYATAANGALTFGTLPVAQGGTGTATAPTKGGIIYASSTTALASTAAGTTGQYLKSNAANAPTWVSFTKPVLTWTGGTTAGPTLKVTTDGGDSDVKAIPSASASASGIITTGAQTFSGEKCFSETGQYTRIRFKPAHSTNNGSDTYGPASIWINAGSTTDITLNKMYFRLYSPTAASGSTTYKGYYEQYELPQVDVNRTANSAYDILTSKTAITVAQGGTGATSFTANSVVVSGSSTTAALTTRAITNITAKGGLGWTTAGGTNIPTLNTLAYWNGRYNASSSNLEYCSLGAFGSMATASADDYIAKSIGTAAGDIIYWTGSGTPTRLAKGSNGQVLTLANGVPSWATVSGSGGVQTDNGNARIYYGTCSTAAGTTAKVVDCTDYTTLQAGDTMIVKFTNTNSGAVGSLTLNVNGTGAKNIKKLYNYTLNNLTHANELHKDLISVFVYNGTYWILTNADYDSNTNTLMRTYKAYATNVELPLIGGSTSTTSPTAPTGETSYADLYGQIPKTTANRATYNLSTGAITIPGGLITKSSFALSSTNPTESVTYTLLTTNDSSNRLYSEIKNTFSAYGATFTDYSVYNKASTDSYTRIRNLNFTDGTSAVQIIGSSGIPLLNPGDNSTLKSVRNIYASTSGPSGGMNGDVWLKYTN